MERALTCKELVELITEYLEETLPPRTRKRIDKHLAICDGCHAYLEQGHFAIRATGMLSEESLSESARARRITPKEAEESAFCHIIERTPHRTT